LLQGEDLQKIFGSEDSQAVAASPSGEWDEKQVEMMAIEEETRMGSRLFCGYAV
jgi:hypothetical protein